MKVIEQVEKLKELNMYNRMLKNGLLSLKVELYYEIYIKYNEYLEDKYSKMESATYTAEDFKVSESTVFNALNFMRL